MDQQGLPKSSLGCEKLEDIFTHGRGGLVTKLCLTLTIPQIVIFKAYINIITQTMIAEEDQGMNKGNRQEKEGGRMEVDVAQPRKEKWS